MRGADQNQDGIFSYLSPAARVPKDHPLRPVKKMVNQGLSELWHDFEAMYAREGRPSIPPEKLLRALLLQVLYTIRSERLLKEQLDYNLVFRWFVGLSMDDPVWTTPPSPRIASVFSARDLAAAFFRRIQDQAAQAGLLSDEHFTVDGTLIEAWASMKSFRPKDNPPPPTGGIGRNPEVDFHGERRLNQTHASTTDPEARLYRKGKGKETKLCFMGHVLMENRHGLIISPRLTAVTGTAEAGNGAAPGRGGSRQTPDYRGRRQRLRYARIRPISARPEGRTPCGPKPHEPLLRHRRPDHPPSGLLRQSAPAQKGGGNLRLDQNGRQSQENPPPRNRTGGLDVHLHCCGVQSGANTQPDGGCLSLNRKGTRRA